MRAYLQSDSKIKSIEATIVGFYADLQEGKTENLFGLLIEGETGELSVPILSFNINNQEERELMLKMSRCARILILSTPSFETPHAFIAALVEQTKYTN